MQEKQLQWSSPHVGMRDRNLRYCRTLHLCTSTRCMRPSARWAFLDRPCGLRSERQLVTIAMMALNSPCATSALVRAGA